MNYMRYGSLFNVITVISGHAPETERHYITHTLVDIERFAVVSVQTAPFGVTRITAGEWSPILSCMAWVWPDSVRSIVCLCVVLYLVAPVRRVVA